MPNELVASNVSHYLEALVPARTAEMQAMEAEAAKTDFPIIGPAAGQLCYLIARLIDARGIFELGSGFGYSTAWFARAVRENGGGVVHHTVWDGRLSERARQHLTALGLVGEVQFHVGEAVQTLQDSTGPFDLIFNDIVKSSYPASLPVIKSRLRPGGVLITDNLLWHGDIFNASDRSANTEGVREFTRLVAEDPDWIASVVPIRDGLLVARRR
jgi:caffeoyl-CoA O-methyltransferase